MRKSIALVLALVFCLGLAVPALAADGVAYPSKQQVEMNGASTEFDMYALKDANGYDTNYIKLRDLAYIMNGTTARFNVDWDQDAGCINVVTGAAYAPNGSEMSTPFSGVRSYEDATAPIKINGVAADLKGILLKDDEGKGYTYYKLRDLGAALGFAVDWSEKRGVYVETPGYAPAAGSGFHMTVGIEGGPYSLDPAMESATDALQIMSHLYEGLMRWTDDGKGNAVLVPGQAESYTRELNDDHTVTYIFSLRKDAKWSDGRPVTAGDFVYAWKRLADPETAADYSYLLECVVGAEDIMSGGADPDTLAVAAPDDRTFEVTTQDNPNFLELCAFPITSPVRRDLVEKYGPNWSTLADEYISNGPYTLTAWEGDHILVTANPEYYDYGKLGPADITFRYGDDLDAIYAQGAHFATGVSSGVEGYGVKPALGTYYLSFNTQKAPFDDWRVRKAFTLAVDRVSLCADLGVECTPAGGLVCDGVSDADGPSGKSFRAVGGDYYDLTSAGYAANCAEAQRLLAEAGYPGGAGFPEVEYLTNISTAHEKVAQHIQADWKRVLGVEVAIEQTDWGPFMLARLEGDFFIARNGWMMDFNDPADFLSMYLTTGANNAARYSNPDFDALVTGAPKAPGDIKERMSKLHQAEDLLMGRDWALCPIYYFTWEYAVRPNVKGVYYNPQGLFYFDRCALR